MIRPILIIALGFITGILLGLYFNIALFFIIGLLLIPILMKFIGYNINNKYIKIVKILIKKNIVTLFIISMLISNLYLAILNNKFEIIYNEFNSSEVIGTIISNNKETEYKNIYILRVEKINKFKNIDLLLRIPKSKNIQINYGDKIKIYGKYSVPDNARNFGGFNYKKYLKTQKIYGIYDADRIELLECNNLKLINIFSNNIKQKIIKNFNKILPLHTNQLFLGILIGYDDNLSEEIEESFRKSSLTHLLAVSGAHITYITIGLTFILGIFKIPKKITYIIIILFLIFFMYITNFSVSVVRASIMGIILIMASILYKKNDIQTTISISIIYILIDNPYKLIDIGLVLSYFATIGIICFSYTNEIKKEKLTLAEKIIEYIKEMFYITVFANILVMPIIIYNYNTISLTFILSNIIAGLLIGPITIGGFILIILSFVNIKFTYLIGILYNMLLELLIQFTNLINKIPLSEIIIPTPSIFFIVFYYIILFIYLLFLNLNKKYYHRYIVKKISKIFLLSLDFVKRYYKIIISYIICSVIIIIFILRIIPNNLKIYFIDVGQGDSTLIITPTNKRILIDSGGSETGKYDVGKNILVPYLLDRKIIFLDYICISHFDSDHCDGFKYLLMNIKVKYIIISRQYETTDNFDEIMSIAKEKGVNVIVVEEGNILNIDKYVKFKILSPAKKLVNDINDNSIVMKLEYGNFSCLFTGDISNEIEQRIVKEYGNELKSTILKVAHHGSKTSSDEKFVQFVNPKVCLIGVGKNNKFGHPNEEVIQTLKKINSQILRTDEKGEISLKINRRRNYKNIYA